MIVKPITGSTRLYALIGDPIEHSLSPQIHNTAFQSLELDCVYLCLRVRAPALGAAVEGVKSLGISGFNVTIPHKVSIMKYLDKVDPLAKDVGAVNTVTNNDGELTGYNTDGLGALRALDDENVDLEGKKVVIMGAGGASRALSYCLTPHVKCVVILNRTEGKAETLATRLRRQFNTEIRAGKLQRHILLKELPNTDILINATPVGMHPHVKKSLVESCSLHSNMVVFDLVYNPLKTQLLEEAKNAEAKTVSGLRMLIHQGALSFELWTGMKPPLNAIYKAVLKSLERR